MILIAFRLDPRRKATREAHAALISVFSPSLPCSSIAQIRFHRQLRDLSRLDGALRSTAT